MARLPSAVIATALMPSEWPSSASGGWSPPDPTRAAFCRRKRRWPASVRRHRHRPDPARTDLPVSVVAGCLRDPTRAVWSGEPEMARLPSAVIKTALISSEWPSSIRGGWLPSRSHTRSVLSSEPEMARLPSAVIATALIQPERPSSTRGGWLPSRSHTRNVWSREPEMARLPSAVIATTQIQPGVASSAPARWKVAFQIPHAQCVVSRAGDGLLAVRRHRDRPDLV